jgi:hypothetical protein
MRGFFIAGCVALLATMGAADAHALDAEVTSNTDAQFYDVRSPTGLNVLQRDRLTTTLGVGVYNMLPSPMGDPSAPDLSFRARVRYDADYGAPSGVSDPTNQSLFVPGFSPGLVDIMYAYIEGRRFLKGMLGFKLGRQYVTDVLGWWAFDGGEATLTTPYYFKVEAYGGLEERGGLPLSTPRFESDGIWRGDRTNFDPQLYPSFQPAAIAPAYGVALESAGVTWLHGRLTYRRVYDTGASNVTEFASGYYAPAVYSGTRISSERLGYAVDGTLANLGGVKAGVVYDFYRAEVTSLYGSLDAYLGKKVTVSADYDYFVPSFDGDSIWNFFAGEPMNDLGLRANVDVDRHLSIAGSAQVRAFEVQTALFNPFSGTSNPGTYSPYPNGTPAPAAPPNEVFPTNGHPFDEIGNVSARWRDGETLLLLRGSGSWGEEGDRVGADVSAQRIFETRYIASARAGVWQWDDKLQPDRDATSFSYVLGVGYRFAQRSQAMVEWEHDINSLVGQRFRLLAKLAFAVGK